jgi:hypothetical protein
MACFTFHPLCYNQALCCAGIIIGRCAPKIDAGKSTLKRHHYGWEPVMFDRRPIFFAGALLSLACGTCHAAQDENPANDALAALPALIEQLESDDFDVREATPGRIAAFGEQLILPVLMRSLAVAHEIEPRPELAIGLGKTLELLYACRAKRIVSEIPRAIAEAPNRYLPPDAVLLKQLDERVFTFQFESYTWNDLAAYLHARTGIQFAVDQAVETMAVDNLRGKSNLRELLTTSCQGGAAYVVRDCVVYITTEVNAHRLRLQRRTFELPVLAGDSAWTAVETAHFATVFMTSYKAGELPGLSLEDFTAADPGRITVLSTRFDQIEETIARFFNISDYPEIPAEWPGWKSGWMKKSPSTSAT